MSATNRTPLFAAAPVDALPEHAHLRPVPEAVINELNQKALIFLANSVELFNHASVEHKKHGRGALFVRYDSLADLEDSAQKNQYKMKYADLIQLLSVNYPPGHKLVKDYNPCAEFVLLLGVACNDTLGGFVFASSLVPRNAQFRVHEAAQIMDDVDRRSVPARQEHAATGLRMCCTLRAALTMSQCRHKHE